ncbi:hypothetical protein [Williamsia sp. 1135]|uniref:hypothetical protein n=1 Tax=Williamsia sp. 1135 TaxID=1889262 RepID=UPI000A112F62|nr:hypothetical protein [Williamsia sp. 1135]ORM35495.1 hypothetical protein BFL43_09245 [Williamsia sp. 1135]
MSSADRAPSDGVGAILEEARQSIHEAVAAEPGSERERSAAHHAESLANTVLLDPAATDRHREYAGYYHADARAMQAPGRDQSPATRAAGPLDAGTGQPRAAAPSSAATPAQPGHIRRTNQTSENTKARQI